MSSFNHGLLFFWTVSAFFSSSRPISFSLPSVVSWLVTQSKKCVTQAATAASSPVRNMQGFIMYLCGLKKNRKKGSNTNLLRSRYIENRVCGCLRKTATTEMLQESKLTWMSNLDGVKAMNKTSLDPFSIDLDSFSREIVIGLQFR